jgi:hypothetical protein
LARETIDRSKIRPDRSRTDNACVRGRSSIVDVGNVALADYQGNELERIDDEFEFNASVFYREGEWVRLISSDQSVVKLDVASSLLGCRTDFFGDWLCESIPKYVAATLYHRFPSVPILVDACMPSSHRHALELMLACRAKIIETRAFQPVQVRHLCRPPASVTCRFTKGLRSASGGTIL